jgi:hypothetical protein
MFRPFESLRKSMVMIDFQWIRSTTQLHLGFFSKFSKCKLRQHSPSMTDCKIGDFGEVLEIIQEEMPMVDSWWKSIGRVV